METLTLLIGLGNLQSDLIANWIGPAFFIVIAFVAIKFVISRQFRELAGLLGIAAVVGLLVFGGNDLFGETGIFTTIARGFSQKLDTGGGTTGGGGMIRIMQNFIK